MNGLERFLVGSLRFVAPTLFNKVMALERRIASLERAQTALIDKAARFVACEMIPGDYLEFGVYKGASFISAYHAFAHAYGERIRQREGEASDDAQSKRQSFWDEMRFFGFDSFEGLPELVGPDQQTNDFEQGQYSASEQEFLHNLTTGGVDMAKVISVPGWFGEVCNDQTWAKLGIQKAAVVWIDGDLYSSARDVLNGLTPLLQDGTVLIFDDWFAFRGNPTLGEQRALREWENNNKEFTLIPFHKEGTWRNSFILSRHPEKRVIQSENVGDLAV